MIAFRHIVSTQFRLPDFVLVMALLISCMSAHEAVGQKKLSVQVKVFDQDLKPMANTEIALNDLDFFETNNKGTAIVELDSTQIPIRNVRVRDEKVEAASWNLSKGIVEVVVRPRTYRLVQFVLRFSDGSPLGDTPIIYRGAATLTTTSDQNGKFELPIGFNEQVRSAEQFSVPDVNIIHLDLGEKENVVLVEKPRPKDEPVRAEAPASHDKPVAFHHADLDSIRSLSGFYTYFSKVPMAGLTEEERDLVSKKFKELVTQKEDSVRSLQSMYVNRISDTSFVAEDIRNLLLQATVEGKSLNQNRADFENRIQVITRKLQKGVMNLSSDERGVLMQDINQLEKLLTENESKFYQNHNDYRDIIAALKEKYFDIAKLESRLSDAERKREEERRLFRQQLFGIGGVVVVFGLLIILLIYFSTRLKKQTLSLQRANSEIEQINGNLEEIVKRRTHLLQEANQELDTFLYKASHDLRSPVRTIVGLCQIMEHIPQQEMVNRVELATESMDRMLNKLIDISEIAQEASRVTDVDVAQVIREVRNQQLVVRHGVSVFRNNSPILINKGPVQFDVKCTDRLTVRSSRSLIEIIITNLVENAIFFSGVKDDSSVARVEITATKADDKLELVIFDNGVGIAETVKPRLFSMFFIGHEKSKGNGLGLYTVHKCVQALHGTIAIQSEEKKFTRVIVTIPVSPKDTSKKRAAIQEAQNAIT